MMPISGFASHEPSRGAETLTFTLNLFALFITEYIKRIYGTLNELKS